MSIKSSAAMRLCPLGHESLYDGGMEDGMVQYDLNARLLGLGDRGPCHSHHTASPSHKERERWVSISKIC
jgi:hypothetical protein